MLRIRFFICFWLVLLVSGCDNSLDPLDRERGQFSIYGTLDLDKQHNFIRVKDLNEPLLPEATRDFTATVTFRNLNTGDSEIMEDSVVKFEDVYTHNFKTTLPMIPDTKYEVEVRDGDRMLSTTATTPRIASTDVNPENGDCLTSIRISFEPVTSSRYLEVEMGFEFNNRMFWGIPVLRDSQISEVVNLQFQPRRFINEVLDPLNTAPVFWCHELSSDEFQIKYRVFGPDYFENTLSDTINVPGGIGKLGALYDDLLLFTIDTTNVCAPFC